MPLILNDLNVIYQFHVLSPKELSIFMGLITYLKNTFLRPWFSNNLNVICKFQVQPPKELPSDWESKAHGTIRNWPWRLCRALCWNSINLWRIQRNVWISTEKLSQTTKRIWLWKGLPTCLWENKQARTQLKCSNTTFVPLNFLKIKSALIKVNPKSWQHLYICIICVFR